MAGIAQAERFQFSELEARIACNQAAQYRYVPNGTQRISAEVGIIKFRYIRIDDRIRIYAREEKRLTSRWSSTAASLSGIVLKCRST